MAYEHARRKFARPDYDCWHRNSRRRSVSTGAALLGVIQKQVAEIQDLRDEIQRLKKTTTRPKIKPSRMLDPPPEKDDEAGPKKKRPGSAKRKKTKRSARQISGTLHCDDTSARHEGKAAVCTHIGNELFASFSTTDSKSRLNFLRLLCQPEEQYRLCEEARACLEFSGASIKFQAKVNRFEDGAWTGREAWQEQLTAWGITNEALTRLHAKREEFLAVLEHPHLALHNNLSENDIREYARLRKISGGTRSDEDRRCRDTFMSLKKTCRKLGVNFQHYLHDRIRGLGEIPILSELMRTTAVEREIAA